MGDRPKSMGWIWPCVPPAMAGRTSGKEQVCPASSLGLERWSRKELDEGLSLGGQRTGWMWVLHLKLCRSRDNTGSPVKKPCACFSLHSSPNVSSPVASAGSWDAEMQKTDMDTPWSNLSPYPRLQRILSFPLDSEAAGSPRPEPEHPY